MTKTKTPFISDVEVEARQYGDTSLSCKTADARYHVWLDRQTHEIRPTLYKNSLEGDIAAPGYFPCRRLKVDSPASAALISAMLLEATSKQLFNKAAVTLQQGLEKQARDNAAAVRAHRIREIAPELYAKLEELYEFFDGIGDGAPDASPTQKYALQAAAEIRALLDKV